MLAALLLVLISAFIQPSFAAAGALASEGVRRQVPAGSWADTQDYSGAPINYSLPVQSFAQEQPSADPAALAGAAYSEDSSTPLLRPRQQPKQMQKSRRDIGRLPPSAGIQAYTYVAPAAPAATKAVRRMPKARVAQPKARVAQSFGEKFDMIKRNVDMEAYQTKATLQKVTKEILAEVSNVDAEAARTKDSLEMFTKDIQTEVNKLKHQLRYEHLVNDELQKDLNQAMQSKIQLEAQLNEATELVAPSKPVLSSAQDATLATAETPTTPSRLPPATTGRTTTMLEGDGDELPKIPDSRGMEYIMNKLKELEEEKAK